MIVTDQYGMVCALNPAAVSTFGYAREELVGRTISTLTAEPFVSARGGYLDAYRQGGQRTIIGKGREVVGRRKDGRCFPLHLSVGEFELNGRRLFVGICHDVGPHRDLLDR